MFLLQIPIKLLLIHFFRSGRVESVVHIPIPKPWLTSTSLLLRNNARTI